MSIKLQKLSQQLLCRTLDNPTQLYIAQKGSLFKTKDVIAQPNQRMICQIKNQCIYYKFELIKTQDIKDYSFSSL